MNTVIPFTQAHPDTVAFGVSVGALFYDVSGDDHAYWRLFCELWAAGAGFVVVEHDIVPTLEQHDGLLGCHGEWCAVPYRVHQTVGVTSLGFTKFGPGLIARHPFLLAEVPPEKRHWSGLDGPVVTGLAQIGEQVHVHAGEVVHHHRER